MLSSSLGFVIIGFLAAAIVGAAGFGLGWLTRDGAIAAALVGGCVFVFAGWQGALILLLFFVSSSLLSRLNRHGGDEIPWPSAEPQESPARDTIRRIPTPRRVTRRRPTPRNARQVLANGLVAAVAAVGLAVAKVAGGAWGLESWGLKMWGLDSWGQGSRGLGSWGPDSAATFGTVLPKVALAGALAAATADTWATEIGKWAKGVPRSALTARVVEPGESGGMTAYGTFGGLVGAGLIGAAAAWAWEDLGVTHAMVIEVAGFAGMWFDSLLGASVQYKAYCTACGRTIEEREHDHPIERPRGWRFVDNDVVNFAATLAGAILAVVGLRSF